MTGITILAWVTELRKHEYIWHCMSQMFDAELKLLLESIASRIRVFVLGPESRFQLCCLLLCTLESVLGEAAVVTPGCEHGALSCVEMKHMCHITVTIPLQVNTQPSLLARHAGRHWKGSCVPHNPM